MSTNIYVYFRTDEPDIVAELLGYWMRIVSNTIYHREAKSIYDDMYFDNSKEPNWYCWQPMINCSNRTAEEELKYELMLTAISKVSHLCLDIKTGNSTCMDAVYEFTEQELAQISQNPVEYDDEIENSIRKKVTYLREIEARLRELEHLENYCRAMSKGWRGKLLNLLRISPPKI